MAEVATLQIKVDSTDAVTARGALDKLGTSANLLEGIIGKLAAAFAALKLAEMIKEATLLSSRYETLGKVMGAVGLNAGYTSSQMEGFAIKMQETGISLIESRNAAIMMAGAQMDMTKSSQLARIAQDAAVIGNINSSEAFARMIQGIRSGQTEVLRTIGINVTFESSYKKLADTLHKLPKDLTDLEKTQARTNAVMSYGSNIAGAYEASMTTAGKQLKSMERYIQNLQVAAGDIFLPAFTASIENTVAGLKTAEQWFKANTVAVYQMSVSVLEAQIQLSGLIKDIVSAAGSGLGQFADDIHPVEIAVQMLTQAVALLRDGVEFAFNGIRLALGGIATIGAYALKMFTDLASLLNNVKPPEWVDSLLKNSKGLLERGQAGLLKTGQHTIEAYTGNQAAETLERHAKAAKTLSDEQEKARAATSRLRIATEQKAEADRLAAEAAKKHWQAGEDLVNAYRDQVATFGFNQIAQEAYKIALSDVSDAHKAAALAALDRKETLIWEQEALERARKEENATTTALEEQTKARINLLTQQREAQEQEGKRLNEQMASPAEKQVDDLAKLNVLMKANVITAETYARRLQEIEKAGISAFSSLLNAVDLFAQHGADAFTNFAMTGKFAWKDMINSIIADLIRLQSQKAFIQLGGYLMGMIGGGATQSVSFSGAGTYDGLPTGGGSSLGSPTGGSWSPGISNTTGKGGAAGTVNSSVVVNIQDGKATSTATADGPNGAEIGRNLEAHMNGWAMKNMRPGGLLNPVGA